MSGMLPAMGPGPGIPTRFTVGHTFRTSRILDFLPVMRAGQGLYPRVQQPGTSPVSLLDDNPVLRIKTTFKTESRFSKTGQKTLEWSTVLGMLTVFDRFGYSRF